MVGTKAAIVIPDRLYGTIAFPRAHAKLFETADMQRLSGIQMSIPSRFLRTPSPAASRFEHCRGVAYLATLTAQLPEFRELGINLVCAAWLHDAGTPAFSHCPDPLMRRVLGMDHEERSLQMAEYGPFAIEARRLGAEPALVQKLMRSWWFTSAPDLDNDDNTPRQGKSMGLLQPSYDPRVIAQAYCQAEGKVFLRPEARLAVKGWIECRQRLYRFIYSHEHQAPYFMLRRALHVAYKEHGLPKDFFNFTDDEAYRCLRGWENPAIDKLLFAAEQGDYYPCLYHKEVIATLAQNIDPLQLADDIAEEFQLAPGDICVGFNKTRGNKPIEIPFLDDRAPFQLSASSQPVEWTLLVYGARDVIVPAADVKGYVDAYVVQALFRCERNNVKVPA